MLEIPLSGIKKIEEIARSSSEYISLSQGSIKVGGIPQPIKNHVQELLKTDKTDYYESCWGIFPLRNRLAVMLSERYGKNFSTSNVLPTHGCIGGLSLLYLAVLSSGDEVIIPEPAYPAYTILTQVARAKAVPVSLFQAKADGDYDWHFDIERIKAATTEKTKIIIFSNPWNPLGIVVPLDVIKELLAWCQERGIFLVVDQAYEDYAFTPSFQSATPLVLESDWLVTAHTFSKNLAMSGWRIGYLVLPESLNKILAGMQDALLNCLNNTAQYAALFALDHPEMIEEHYKIIAYNRQRAVEMLQPLAARGHISFKNPEGGFYIFLKTNEADALALCMDLLHKAKVALIPGVTFGASSLPFLRLNFARELPVLEEGIKRINAYFG